MRLTLEIALLVAWTTSLDAFVTKRPSTTSTSATTTKAPFVILRSKSLFDDFEEFASENNNNSNSNNNNNNNGASSSFPSSDADLYAALRARQAEMASSSSSSSSSCLDYDNNNQEGGKDEEESAFWYWSNWRNADCESTVRLTLDDWIRRIAIDTYPLVVCGSAKGSLYLADLSNGEELDCLMQVHPSQVGGEEGNYDENAYPLHIEEALKTLYEHFDGGGVVALGLKGDLIVSAGRDGGVHVSTIVGQEEDVYKGSRGGTSRQTRLTLQRQGKIRGLDIEGKVLITSLAFDDVGTLWLGGYDGILRGYDYEDQDADHRPLMLRQKHPLHEINIGTPIVNLSINDKLGCGVASTVSDGIVLFSLDDGEILGRWNPLVKKVRNEFVRAAILVQNDLDDEDPGWSVVCGGSKGSLFQRQLNVDRSGFLSDTHPFLDQVEQDEACFPVKMRPNHLGPVVAFASPLPGILVSGGLDGTMRVWDLSNSEEEEDVEEVEAQYDDVRITDNRPECLYALSGYKVWLGSIFADSKKLVADGADNTIIVHSFDEDEEDVLFREDDEDEGLSFE